MVLNTAEGLNNKAFQKEKIYLTSFVKCPLGAEALLSHNAECYSSNEEWKIMEFLLFKMY